MEKPILSDRNIFPSEEIIFPLIGKSKKHWQSLFNYIHINYPYFQEEWKYYIDGKSWLLKVVKKSKTIFWISINQGSFNMTFYFTDRAEPAILESSIAECLKEQFVNGKRFNKIRGLVIHIKSKEDIEDAKLLIALKLSIK